MERVQNTILHPGVALCVAWDGARYKKTCTKRTTVHKQ